MTYPAPWNNDDQPLPMKVKSGKMFAIPYRNEINDSRSVSAKAVPASNTCAR